MNDDMLTPPGEPTTAPTAVQPPVEPQAPAAISDATPETPSTDQPTEPEPAPIQPMASMPEPEVTVPQPEPVVAEPPVAEVPPIPTPETVPTPVPTLGPTPEPAPAPATAAPTSPAPRPAVDDSALFEAAMAELEGADDTDPSYRKLTKGDRVEATVIQVENDRVFVDLGTKSEGVVPLAELTEGYLETAHGHVEPGDKIQVVVLRGEGAEGNPIVSKKRAEFEETWNRIVESFGEGATFTAQVVDRVKGGLVVDIGVRGFVPATHVGNGRLRNIEKYVGQSIPLKIIEIDRERKKVVLSNKLAEEERREAMKEEIFTKVAIGDILDGAVRRLTDYGAFIDLGGIDGLLHISEMSWMRISHPREVLKEGQKIKVMVLKLDPTAAKISLGLRQVLPDPWSLIRENYRVGQKLQCQINRLVQSGAFVKLPEGAEAFLPISEMSNRRINKPSDVVEEGQEVEVSIIELDPSSRRMVLSLRGSQPMEPRSGGDYQSGGGYGGGGGYDDDFRGKGPGKKGPKKRRGGGRGDDEFDEPIVGRVPTGGATIGERLGMLKGFLGRSEDEDEDTMIDETETEVTAEVADTPAPSIEPQTVEVAEVAEAPAAAAEDGEAAESTSTEEKSEQ